MAKQKNGSQIWLRACFLLYCAAMLWLLFIHERTAIDTVTPYWDQVRQNCNLTPFHTISVYFYLLRRGTRDALLTYAIVNFLGNILVFIPWGIFLPGLWHRYRSFWRFFLCSAGVIILIELVQLFTLLGSCDIDDLFLNLIGAAIGYILFCIGWRKKD